MSAASITPCALHQRLAVPMMVAWLSLLAASCTETQLAAPTAKRPAPGSHDDSIVATYKIGKPYRINGVWYRPAVDYGYVETGIASWYGPKFHRRRTANGQIFDMNAVTAAHRTLPLPSIVRVTNLENGRSIKVLVNDRGPFARGRIIDVSRRTAQLLGFERNGIARVRVEIDADESRRIALVAQGRGDEVDGSPGSASIATVATLPQDDKVSEGNAPTPAPTQTAVPVSTVTTVPVPVETRLFIQAGAFTRRDLADRLQQSLSPIGPTRIEEATVANRRYYRVRVGPVPSVSDGDRILEQVVASGYPEARLVVD